MRPYERYGVGYVGAHAPFRGGDPRIMRPASSRTGFRGAKPTFGVGPRTGFKAEIAGQRASYEGDLLGLAILTGLAGYGIYRATR